MRFYSALFVVFALCLSGCGYRLNNTQAISIHVPYVVDDRDGQLTDALIYAIGQSPHFRYEREEGDWTLSAKIVGDRNERIGYRFDRELKVKENSSGESIIVNERRPNIIAVENRKEIAVEVSLTDNATGELLLGPQKVKLFSDYDYIDPNSRTDVFFQSPFQPGNIVTINFSMGQLDAVGPAGDDASIPLFRALAQRIVEGILALENMADEQDLQKEC